MFSNKAPIEKILVSALGGDGKLGYVSKNTVENQIKNCDCDS